MISLEVLRLGPSHPEVDAPDRFAEFAAHTAGFGGGRHTSRARAHAPAP